jgi:hypothetical protein
MSCIRLTWASFTTAPARLRSRAALSATYLADETPFGKRWISQDAHSGEAAAIAGIESGDILLNVNGREIIPPAAGIIVLPHLQVAQVGLLLSLS